MSAPRFDDPVRTLIVEDQGIFRTFLKQWFLSQEKFDVVGTAASAEEALRLAQELRPNFLVVDMHLPGMDGLALVRAVRQTRPEIRSLIFTSLTDPLAITRIRESGVEGYLEKDCTPDELAEAVKAVAAGRTYFSPRFRDAIRREGSKPLAVGKLLSRREQQVLSHVLEGKTSREIGELVGLSARTVEFHRANLMAKLGSPSPTDLFVRVKKLGLR